MAHPSLTLDGVSYVLPDGTSLFSQLNEQFDQRRTGLVGRNGVGKTVLARILAGQLAPSSGRCVRTGSVHYLAQQVAPPAGATVASLAGVQGTLDALARIEAGSCAAEDFDAVGDRWDIHQQWALALARCGLRPLDPHAPASTLSGGEAVQVALAGAWLSAAQFLILDEPSNHLDGPRRAALVEQLRAWPRGLIVVSHDRQLLDAMERTVELSSLGLRSHGGGYAFYAQCRAREQQAALQELDLCRREQRRAAQDMQAQRERLQRRQARGARQGKEANQAKILIDRQKERSQDTAAKLQRQHMALQAQRAQRVHAVARQVADDGVVALHGPPQAAARGAPRRVLVADAVELPFVAGATRHISLAVHGRQRIGVVGPNGSGKSTLLRVMAGALAPAAGTVRRAPGGAWLDQRLQALDPARDVLSQLQAANRTAAESALRMRLAQLGLDASRIAVPSGRLSGGERLKAALACLVYADPAPQWLLLDEPCNHLDLPSLQALQTLLRGWMGALVVVSHDAAFLDALALTDRLAATDAGWRLQPWPAADPGGPPA